MMEWILYFSVLAMVVLLTIAFILFQGAKKKEQHPMDEGTPSSSWKHKSDIFFQKSYTRSMRIPFVNTLTKQIRKRVETLAVYDEYAIRREVMRIVFSILAITVTAVFILLFVRPDWLVLFWIVVGVIFLSGVLVDLFVHRVDARLLNQLKDFNNRIRFFFQQTKMVDVAIEESIPFAGPEMRVQATRINDIMTSVYPDKELTKYEEVAPSRFLKVIAGLALLVKDMGDVVSDKGSAFLRGLSAVNQELNGEIMYRSKLSYHLRNLTVLALVPIFLALPIKKWAVTTFPIMHNFYNSRIGFLSEVLVYGVAVMSYLLIRKMREINEPTYQSTNKRWKWEEWMLKRIPFLSPAVQLVTPASHSKEHFKLSTLLKEANSSLQLNWLTLHRMLLVFFTFVLLTGGLLYSHNKEKQTALFSTIPTNLFTGKLTEQELLAYEEKNEFDRRLIADFQEMKNVTRETIQTTIAEELKVEDVNDLAVLGATHRVYDKWVTVENAFIKWWEILLILLVAFLMWQVPLWILYFQRNMRYKDMENEVHQFLVLLGILREFDRMSVYVLLSWLERFAVVFKEPIQEALQSYDSGPEEALDQLSEQVSFEPFNQIIERLKLSVVRISIEEAFDDVDLEREYLLEQRLEANKRSIESKSGWGHFLGLAPAVVLVLVYLVFPLVYLGVTESQDLYIRIR